MSEKQPRPDPLEFDLEGVPDQLRDRDQWVAWCYKWKPDREEWTKAPIDAEAGRYASSTDPDTWTSLGAAVAYHERGDTDTDGIGFVVHEGDIVVGVDLDDCRDPDTGDREAWADTLLDDVQTYTEVSPSGTGLRLFGLGFVPDGGNRGDVDGADGHIEMYDSGRYLTVTGHAIDGAPDDVRQVNDEIMAVHDKYIADDEPAPEPQKTAGDGGVQAQTPDADPGFNTTGPGSTDGGGDLTDDEILEKARDAENGDKFARLWIGDTSGYESHSEADLALCGLLAFWTGGDRRRMDDLFRQSGLHRDKWDEDRGSQTYGERTIGKALEGRTEFYDPDGAEGHPTDRNLELGADGPATTATGDVEFGPREIAVLAGVESLAELNDREKAYFVAHQIALSDEVHVLAAQPDGTIYRYDDGVWTDAGEQLLREISNQALQAAYGSNTLTEIVERIRATCAVSRDELGSPAGTIAVENGLLDLDSRALRELEPDDYALTRIPVEYDPDATAPRWEQFIDEVVEENRRDAIQEYVGYCLLVGELPIHRALMLVGEGSNGKSEFLRVVKALLGDENISAHPLQKLTESEQNVADLYGKVANIHADLSSRGLGDGGMFKTLVGGDTVTGRRLYQEPFSFEATAKQLYSANQVPDVSIDDEAFFRRWLLVEFPNQFTDPDKPGPDKDPTLTDELLDELPGILNWALDGLDRLLDQGHFTGEGDPLDKRDRWLSWGDTISKFIDECVDTSRDGKWRTGDVHARYVAWCREELGEQPEAQQTLTKELKKCEGVQYGNYRFDGKRDRGLKGFDIADDVPPAHDADPAGDSHDERDGRQTSLSQSQAATDVLETIRELEPAHDGLVPIEAAAEAATAPDDRAEHFIQKLLRQGDLVENETGKVRTV